MKKSAFVFLIVCFNIISPNIYSQDDNTRRVDSDHLLPLQPQFGILKDYNLKIQNILFDGISDIQFIQFLSKPSFGYESVLVIEINSINAKNPDFNMVYHECTSSIGSSLMHKDTTEIIVDKFRKPISKEDAWKISNLYSAALLNVCEDNKFGIDGNSYDFATMTRGGRAWLGGMPKGETKVEQLVLLSQSLVDLTKSKNKTFTLNDDLSLKIENLTNEFK